jgi:hypothetical protein
LECLHEPPCGEGGVATGGEASQQLETRQKAPMRPYFGYTAPLRTAQRSLGAEKHPRVGRVIR